MRPGKADTLKLSAGNSTRASPRCTSSGVNAAFLAARICSRDQGGDLTEGCITVFSPMGLDEHAVDLLQIDAAGLVAHGFDEGSQTEIFRAAQEPFAGAHDEGECILGEGVVAQAGAVE